MSKRQRRQRRIANTPVEALYASMREGRLQPMREWIAIGASHTPTTARLFGGGFKGFKGTVDNSRKGSNDGD